MQLTPINAPPLNEGLTPTLYITATPGTDLWRKPPSTDIHNAPFYVLHMPVSNFHRARVTVKAKWGRQYDQGGLVLFRPGWPLHMLWVKSGIEFVDGKAHVSTVGARDAADWSLLPIPGGGSSITFEIEREDINEEKETGSSLWVYLIEGEKRTPVREMTWVFKDEPIVGEILSVGIYAARPTKEGDGDKQNLEVTFEDLTIG